MTSVLNVDSIADKAGTGPVGLTKQQAAKAWIQYLQATPVISASFNVSSVTDSSTGAFTINYTNAFSSDAHARSLMSNGSTFCGAQARGTSSDGFDSRSHDNTLIDTANFGTITGDLA